MIQVIDSHTCGEPTRIIVEGAPELPGKTVAEKRTAFRAQFDWLRSATVNEPRGWDVLVGGLLLPPVNPTNVAGVIFFNNAGMLNMCGHGTIGLVATLAYMKRIEPGRHRLETSVGVVEVTLHDQHRVTLKNVPCYRYRKDVRIEVPGYGAVTGDVAWGGNWFFLVHQHQEELHLRNVERLSAITWQIRQTLTEQGITGEAGGEIDHIELFGPSSVADGKNFVLCPGRAYDRSPCGTGTSAKLACLVADGKLKPGQVWRQESIVGSIFEGTVELEGDAILPIITGSAYVTGEAKLILDPDDPYSLGIRSL